MNKLNKFFELLIMQALLHEEEIEPILNNTEKHQGDKVKLVKPVFAMYLHKVKDEKPLFPGQMNDERFEKEVEPMKDEEFIVISQSDVHFEFNCGHCDKLHVADIVIASLKTREEYYIFYDMIELIEGDE